MRGRKSGMQIAAARFHHFTDSNYGTGGSTEFVRVRTRADNCPIACSLTSADPPVSVQSGARWNSLAST